MLSEAQVEDNVALTIPSVNRGSTDARNIIFVIADVSESGMYSVAVKAVLLITKYSRNQFDLRATALYTVNDMSTENVITLCCTT